MQAPRTPATRRPAARSAHTGQSGFTGRWPDFARVADSLGFASVHAVPMRLQSTMLGALGLFGNTPGALNDEDLALAQALIHVAASPSSTKVSIDRDLVNAQLQHALTSRIALEQAKGALAYEGNLELQDAFAALRRYARDHQRRLTVVGRARLWSAPAVGRAR